MKNYTLTQLNIRKYRYKFQPDDRKVITRYYYPCGSNARALNIWNKILALPEEKVDELLGETLDLFLSRHRDIKQVFRKHYKKAGESIKYRGEISTARKLLIGSYFTMEYSPVSTALFNPSMVPHPDQGSTRGDDLKFIQSFRAVGEGHISSILFTEGVIKKNGELVLEKENGLLEQGAVSLLSGSVYEIVFNKDTELSSRIIFPVTENERMGIEDARFVRFKDDNGKYIYYATYTAYDGEGIFPKLIETEDFNKFRITLLRGRGSQNKGMALFPEKINGKYVMISRGDNENLFLMYSDDVYTWENPELDRKSTRLNSIHIPLSLMPSSA